MSQLVRINRWDAEHAAMAAKELAGLSGGCVSIGNFDGVHRGHAELLARLRSQAKRMSVASVAVVFDPHPAAILRPDAVPPRLTWIERRGELIVHLGIDALVVVQASPQFLQLTAKQFFDDFVVGTMAARGMVEGPNFFFGKNRGGDIAMLKQLCQASDIELEIADPTKADADDPDEQHAQSASSMISSSRIRQRLTAGDVCGAAKLLGRPHRIRGTVVTGVRRGRQIGFPTANLDQIDVMLPAPGVYAGYAVRPESGNRHAAAIHLGKNPTFEDRGGIKFEVHLLDYSGSLYGSPLQVDFVDRLRDVQKFDGVVELQRQLQTDIAAARRLLLNVDP